MTYVAGTGLTLTGNSFAANTSVVQSRISNSCPAGSSIRSIDVAGGVACEIDDNTTYIAGSGVALADGVFSLQRTCAAGEILKWSGSEWLCAADDSRIYTAGVGLTLNDGSFAADLAVLQGRVSGTCPEGSYMRAIASDGTVTCQVASSSSYSAGSGLALNGQVFTLRTDCSAGQLLKWTGTEWVCASDAGTVVSYVAGTGLALSGSTFSADLSAVQARVFGACAAGSSIVSPRRAPSGGRPADA